VSNESPIAASRLGICVAGVQIASFSELQGMKGLRLPVPSGEATTFDLTNQGSAIHNMHVANTGGK